MEKLLKIIKSLVQKILIKNYEQKKLTLLCAAACLIAACYSILRPLKISVFFHIVGKEYYPLSKFLMIIVAIPLVAWYSKLVDQHKKHHVLCILFTLYSILCLFFSYFLMHPVFGLSNTASSPYRLFGWVFSILLDFYPTFVIGTLWSFINSISTPDFAKKSYGIIYAWVKIGSIIATVISFLLTRNTSNKYIISILVIAASLLTFFSILFILKIANKIPPKHLSGYEGEDKIESKSKSSLGIIEGLKFMITNPYVFGIFLLFYFYDVIFTVIEYQAITLLSTTVNSCKKMSSLLFLSAFISQLIGLALALFLTSRLLKKIKLKFVLIIMPMVTVAIVLSTAIYPSLITMLAAITLLPSFHYGLYSPAKEMLFIPTVKDIQFKSKAWMDSFGRTLSKSSGSAINMFPFNSYFNSVFSLILSIAWATTCFALGNFYQKTVDRKIVIGKNKDSP